MSPQVLKEMPTRLAMLIAGIIVAVMGFTMIRLEWVPHLSLLLVLCALFGLGKLRGLTFESMQEQMITAVRAGFGAIYLFFLYWADGHGFDDVRGDSDLDVLWL